MCNSCDRLKLEGCPVPEVPPVHTEAFSIDQTVIFVGPEGYTAFISGATYVQAFMDGGSGMEGGVFHFDSVMS